MVNKVKDNQYSFLAQESVVPDILINDNVSPLDLPVTLTRFQDRWAKAKTEKATSLRGLADAIRCKTAPSKGDLPLIKLASFGDVPTVKGSLRHNSNLLSVSGVEADYDAGIVSPGEAANLLKTAGVSGLIYTSPSHTPEAPRWRVLAPLSRDHAPDDREGLCARLNGALGGILAGESFALSQSYYAGGVAGKPPVETLLIEGDYLDRVQDVPQLGKNGAAYVPRSTADPYSLDDLLAPAPKPIDWEEIRRALYCIPPEVTRDDWRKAGGALHHASDGSADGFTLWQEWSEMADYTDALDRKPFNLRIARKEWEGFGAGHFNVESLFYLARQHGYDSPRIDVSADDFDDLPTAAPDPDILLDDLAAKPAPAALIEWFHETPVPRSAPYLVRGILDQGATSCMYGASNSGKTFAAVDLSFALATAGQDATWNGARIKRAAVLYCALEGGSGFQKRVRAMQEQTGCQNKIPFAYRRRGANLLAKDDKGDVKTIIAAARELQQDETAARLPLLIVIDTLSRALAGGDENGPQDMTAFISNVDRIREATGAHVMIVHHTGKDQAKGMRGHSSLLAAIDSELEVTRPDAGKIVCLRVGKQRDSRSDYDLANAALVTVQIGIDAEGEAIESAVLEWGAGKPVKQGIDKLPRTSRIAAEVLEKIQPASRDVWRDACIQIDGFSESQNRGGQRTAFNRAFDDLDVRHWFICRDGLYSIDSGFDDLPERDTGDTPRHSVETVSQDMAGTSDTTRHTTL